MYHVTTRGVDRRDIFHDEQDRAKFLGMMAAASPATIACPGGKFRTVNLVNRRNVEATHCVRSNMVDDIKIISLPFTVRINSVFKWAFLICYVAFLVFLWLFRAEMGNDNRETSLVVQAGFVVVAFILYPVAIVSMFYSRTVFFDGEIEQTNAFFVKKRYSYEDIERVEKSRDGYLRLSFRNKKRIKVWGQEHILDDVVSILNSKGLIKKNVDPDHPDS